MFTIDADIKDLKVKERNLAKAFFSMNNHQVATPEMMSEEARSYIIFFREAGGKMSAYIGIHLLLTGRQLFYSHTSNPFPERDSNSVEEEAISFAESLGAMLDEVNLSTMSRDEKERWIDAQDIFTPDRAKPVVPEAPVPPAQAASEAETPSVPQQPLQLQPVLPVQDMQQPPQKTQPVAAVSVIPQSTQAQQVQQDAVPQAPKVPPSLQEQKVQQQPVQQAEKEAAPAAHAEEEIWEFTEQAYTKAAHASPESKERHEIIQEAIKAGIVKPSKPKMKKEVQPATGVVSRDREALARLLASF
jgi:hypothetical protein